MVIVDVSDPLGPTRYVAEPWSWPGGGIAIMVCRHGCKAWRLGVWPTLSEARAAVDAWIVGREQREGGA